MLARRLFRGLATHARRRAGARRSDVQHRTEEAPLRRLQFAGDRRLDGGADMALLRHRIDQAERLRPAGALGLAGQHHGHGLHAD